jgi:DNA polymerase-4
VVPTRRERSIGSDETFAHDVDDPAFIHRELLKLSDRTAARVRKAGLVGRTVSIKVRFADFTTITRSRTLRDPTDVSREIYGTARSLFDALGLQRARVRLVGVRMEQLLDAARAPVQGLLGEPEHGWRDADRAVDRASARFGAGAVRRASLVSSGNPGSRTQRGDLS